MDDASDEDDIIFKAYLNSDIEQSVVAATFELPSGWVEDGWGYNISYNSGTNQILIKVYPLVLDEFDQIIYGSQDDDGGVSINVSVAYLEGQLVGGVPNQTSGVQIFSSDNITAKIYPNPATKDIVFVKIELPYAKTIEHVVTITNINGRVVFKSNFENLENKISLAALENGIYIIKVEANYLLLKQEKLIIQK